jgi:pyruvate/2-oxoacid:ferredoxin oxidoreductase alpha subunit/NAD-dependent dihydropyrimidine dehydrogenase PreA subunit
MARQKPKPYVLEQYCKGCGRCVDACNHHCLELGTEIDPATGLAPIVLHIDDCTACGLCFEACPEPYGLAPIPDGVSGESLSPDMMFGPRQTDAPAPVAIPDQVIAMDEVPRVVVAKGTYASAMGALLSGCRHFFGYPITPSTEGAELMAKLLPELQGHFFQAVSEVATINMMYGCGGAGLPTLTYTSSPGFSLMLEGLSYMIGAEVPGVIVNVMRGGPGLGNIAPEQADVKLVCRGLGHGHTHAIALVPGTPQEMLDFTMLAFELSFRYRNPVIVLCDGYLGQMTGRVTLPATLVKPGIPEWAVYGDREHRRNLISSIYLLESDLEEHNLHLQRKYELIESREARADLFQCDDQPEVVLVAFGTPSRMVKGAVRELREQGVRAGLFRPQTLWPFPTAKLLPLLHTAKRLIVVEASLGQLEDEVRLALSHAEAAGVPRIEHIQRAGGSLPAQNDIVAAALAPPRLPARLAAAHQEVVR